MIRKAVEADIDAIEKIYDAIITQEEAREHKLIGWVRGIYPTRQTAMDALQRGTLFVLEHDGEIAAAARIDQTQGAEYAGAEWEYDAADDEIMVMHTLVVDPAKGGKGYGRAFVDHYKKYAAENGCRYLRMDTNVKNSRARSLYASLGFMEAGVVPCTSFNGINGVKLVCLEKKL